MAFKYSLILKGNYDELSDAGGELQKLGYKHKGPAFSEEASQIIVNNAKMGGSDILNGEFGLYGKHTLSRDYTFELSDSIERQAALAIAAIHDDEEGHVGEYVKCLLKGVDSEKSGKITGKSFNNSNWIIDGMQFSYIVPRQAVKMTPEEIIAYFQGKEKLPNIVRDTPKPYEERRKVVAYTLKKGLPGVLAYARFTWDGGKGGWYYKIDSNHEYVFSQEEVQRDLEWFEAVYEEEIKSEQLIVGNRKDEIIISSKGGITLVSSLEASFPIKINEITKIIEYFRRPNLSLAGWAVTLPKNYNSIRIGCVDEDHRFSIEELEKVVEVYNRLNPK